MKGRGIPDNGRNVEEEATSAGYSEDMTILRFRETAVKRREA